MIDSNYINYLLKSKGSSQAKLAERLEVSRQAIHGVIYLKIRSKKIAKAISQETATPINDLFPDGRYSKAA